MDPEAYLREFLTRIADHPVNRIADLLPRSPQSRPTQPLLPNRSTHPLPISVRVFLYGHLFFARTHTPTLP
jgi:hypothetical protein